MRYGWPRRPAPAGRVALAATAIAVLLSCRPAPKGPAVGTGAEATKPSFVASVSCKECHPAAYEAWRGSDHERAMMPATPESVLGDFDDASFTTRGATSRFFRRDGRYFVSTAGSGGAPGEFEVTFTFGVRPLQQYLVPFPGGRLQALPIAWDTERKRWFDLNPDREIQPSDWLHWTRNGQNWNGMCAGCHSTHLRKNFDPEGRTYSTAWSDVNVGCEACHGPGSEHVAWALQPADARAARSGFALAVDLRGLPSARRVELCAPCHSRRSALGDDDHAGRGLVDLSVPSLLSEGLYHADGQQLDEVFTWGSFVQSRMYARGLECGDCHDPHTATLRAPGNAVCVRCHNAAGAVLREGIDGSGLQRKEYDSPAHHFHRAGSPGSACVDCHAPPRAYMIVDPRHDHSFRIPRPDLSPSTGAPNACNACHADRTSDWTAAAVARWYGPERRREAHYGEALAAGRAGRPEAGAALRALAESSGQPVIVRATALELLGRYPGAETTRVVRAALAAADPLLRQVAAGALDLDEPPDRAATLAPLLAGAVRGVRLVALAELAGTPRELLPPDRQPAFDRALEEYVAAMRHSLDFASSGLNLGNLYGRLGQPAEAERFYRLALGVDDLFFPAKLNLSVLLGGQGRTAEAEALLREVLAAYPENGEAAYSLGLLLAETGRPEEAAEQLARVVAAAPGHPRAGYNLGLLLAQLGRAGEARSTLSKALELEPASWELLFALADLELRSGRPRDALALAERMRAVRPGDPTADQVADAAKRALDRKPRAD